MAKGPTRHEATYRSVFGYYHPSRLDRDAWDAMDAEAADRAADLAAQYGLPDVTALLHRLHCLADEWHTSESMRELADAKRLEVDRLRVHEDVSQALATLEDYSPAMYWLEQRLRRDSDWDSGALRSMLGQLNDAAAQPFEDKFWPEPNPSRRDSDARRQWLVLSLASFYESASGDNVRAYSDDGQRTGNAGAKFVHEVYAMLTGDSIRLSTVERLIRRSTTMGVAIRRGNRRPSK